jgi:hypothetical protein
MMLSPDELFELTHRTRPSAQMRALRYMGIECRVRPDGSVAVLRLHVEAVLGGSLIEHKKSMEPNWRAI